MLKQGKLKAEGSRGSNPEECEDRSYKVKVLCGGVIKSPPLTSLWSRAVDGRARYWTRLTLAFAGGDK